jgi:hypothetical protein
MESMIEALTGRAGENETKKRYVKGYRVQRLYMESSIFRGVSLEVGF